MTLEWTAEELEQMECDGLVVDTGETRKGAKVWVITERGRDVLRRFTEDPCPTGRRGNGGCSTTQRHTVAGDG